MEDNKTKDQEPSWLQILGGLAQLYVTAHQKIYEFVNIPEIKDGIVELLEFTHKLDIYTQKQKEQMKVVFQKVC